MTTYPSDKIADAVERCKLPRALVVTADQQLWPHGHHLHFLGRWCIRYDERATIARLPHSVMPPLGWTPMAKRLEKTLEHQALEAELFPLVCEGLNQVLERDFDSQEWKILIGPWFRRAVRVLFNRIACLRQVQNIDQFAKIQFFNPDHVQLATNRSRDFTFATSDAVWNAALWQKIWSRLDFDKQRVEFVNLEPRYQPIASSEKEPGILRRFIYGASKYFSRTSKYVVISSYLPLETMSKMMLRLGQLPQVWTYVRPELNAKCSGNFREKFGQELKSLAVTPEQELYASLISDIIPISYLEGFQEVGVNSQKVGFSRQAQVIFTSNSFDVDEEFGQYVVGQRRRGARYVIGQHGNNYDASIFENPSPEETACDQFISWGQAGELENKTPAFLFKFPKPNTLRVNRNGGILLVQYNSPHQSSAHDALHEFDYYMQDQFEFVDKLNHPLRYQTTIRLARVSNYLFENEPERWRKFDPKIEIDNSGRSIVQAISENRIVVHAYNSTGILEGLNQNIPTVGFWREPLEQLRPEARQAHQKLLDANIIFESPESAADHINSIYYQTQDWWRSEEVQSARRVFCKLYADTSQKPASQLAHILESVDIHRMA